MLNTNMPGIRASDNHPCDPISMTILGQTKADQYAIISAAVHELAFGELDRIEAIPVFSPDGRVLCQKFVVFYKRWDPLNTGAEVRQTLQNHGKMKIRDSNGHYLWTVEYNRGIKTSKPKPIKTFCPYGVRKSSKKIEK